MIRKAWAAAIAISVVTAPAVAKGAAAASGAVRYMFERVEGGFLRLDTQTGQVAFCGPQTVGWACLAAPEDRAMLETEIVRLQRENGLLKEDLLSRGLPLPPGVMPEPPSSGERNLTLRLPGTTDVGRVVLFVGRMWRRLVEAIARAQNQLLHRS